MIPEDNQVKKSELEALTCEISDSEEETARVEWASKAEYLLSLIGYSVGYANIWRFPFMCMKHGGGAFLIPFIFFMAICGLPLYLMELGIGQFSGKSPMVIWSICPLFQGLGFSMVILSLIVTWYYGAVLAWVLNYLVYSFFPVVPWSSCDNVWNSENCVGMRYKSNIQVEKLNATFIPYALGNSISEANSTITNSTANETRIVNNISVTAATEFWRHKIVNISSGMFDLGNLQWHMVLALFVAYALSFLSIIKGVRSVGKVAYVTALVPYVLLTVMLCRSLTLDGSFDGVLYFIKPEFSRLMDYQVWLDAALQVIFSLGPGWGGVITMASYSKFNNPFMRDGIIVTTTDCLSALYCGLVVFSAVGYLAKEAGLSIEDAAEAGPGLIFIAYPETLARLPLPQVWSVLFFIMMLLIGIDSQFGMLETVISGLVDMYPRTLGRRKLLLLAFVFLLYYVTSLIFATRASVYIFVFIDWYASAFCMFLTTALECAIIGWIYGAERFSQDVVLMIGRPLPIMLRLSICILTPLVLTVALIITLINYDHPTYKGYVYPDYTRPIGILVGLLAVIPVPSVVCWQIWKSSGSIKSRLTKLLKPTDWIPHHAQLKYSYTVYKYEHSISKIMLSNLIGNARNKKPCNL